MPRTKKVQALGSLEEATMNVLWQAGPLSVREVNRKLASKGLAYTTVMTTLDRLFKKGLLTRSKDGFAYVYEPALTRDEFQQRLVQAAVSGLMTKKNAVPVLAAFVDAAAGLDEENLARLEALIAERRRRGE